MRNRIFPAALAVAFFLPAGSFAQGGFSGPGRYEISNLKSGRVIDLDSNDGRTVIQFESRGTDNQIWEARQGNGGYFFINAMNGNALTATSDRNSAPLEGRPFNRSNAQQWRVEAGKDGSGILVNMGYGDKAIDVPDGTSRNGQRLQTYSKNGDSNQRFNFRLVSYNSGGGFGGDRPNRPSRPNRPNRPGQSGGSVFEDDLDNSGSAFGNSANLQATTDGSGDARLANRSVTLRRAIISTTGVNANIDFETTDGRTLKMAGRITSRDSNEVRLDLRTFDNQRATGTATIQLRRGTEVRGVTVDGTQRDSDRFTVNFRGGRF